MTNPDPEEVLELFLLARLLAEDERSALLAQRCDDRPGLRAEVESLLAHAAVDSSTGDGIARAARSRAPGPEADSKRPERLGQYRIVSRLGAGGFGEVFVAEQESPVARRVALKVLTRRSLDGSFEARFAGERQAVAMMDHPAIARLYDAGQHHDGRLWFSMELVEGLPLTTFAREHRLALEDRLRLFRDVVRGVEHAHSRGIIHRDLKPENVLATIVDGVPVAKLIDFGIAKAVELGGSDPRPTAGPARPSLGTLRYMSPEQAMGRADVDVRSDVYSLGVLLEDLVQDSADVHERPRGLAKGVRWIVERATASDPAGRYQTAHGLALDLDRLLTRRPIAAGPSTLGYRATLFAARHRLLAVAVGGVAISLVAGTVISLLSAQRANAERARLQRTLEFVQGVLEAVPQIEGAGLPTTAELTAAARALELPPAVVGGLLLIHAETRRIDVDQRGGLEALSRSRATFREGDSTVGELRATSQAISSFVDSGDLARAADAAEELVDLAGSISGEASWLVAWARARAAMIHIDRARESRQDEDLVAHARKAGLDAIDAFDRAFGDDAPAYVRARCRLVASLASVTSARTDRAMLRETHSLAAAVLPENDASRLAVAVARDRHDPPPDISDRIALRAEIARLARSCNGPSIEAMAAELKLGGTLAEAGRVAEAEESFRRYAELRSLSGGKVSARLAGALLLALGPLRATPIGWTPAIVTFIATDACTAWSAQETARPEYRGEALVAIGEFVIARGERCGAAPILLAAARDLDAKVGGSRIDRKLLSERVARLEAELTDPDELACIRPALETLARALRPRSP
ncbi:MAG TPA: serine/threonine-protein kinase [Phycisphaerales bacterium]|nr:serine/threonine-protein kinase [Phycisphaerales bacterium]HMP37948.1 serine/threonine-protein kinase [Phycisphaerales bacterium]